MMLAHSPKGKYNKMTYYLYPGVILFGTNIIISKIVETLYNPTTLEVKTLGNTTIYNERQYTT